MENRPQLRALAAMARLSALLLANHRLSSAPFKIEAYAHEMTGGPCRGITDCLFGRVCSRLWRGIRRPRAEVSQAPPSLHPQSFSELTRPDGEFVKRKLERLCGKEFQSGT